ncbi:hypothetical protein DKX38_016023 [Salix brachista]|uniref:Uncharacterized protein n=1 Tax=Salix brachista TaxID=2182728 RepID=A0A5N5L7E2_9ROSI|nr:hypothetical protein DKX38_016023 [Salix brachista]
MNTHVERGYGVERGQIPEPEIPFSPVNSQADKNIGCSNAASKGIWSIKSSNTRAKNPFLPCISQADENSGCSNAASKELKIFSGKKNLGKVNTQSIGIQSDPEGSSTEIPVKLCNNDSEIPGSKDLILRADTTTNHLKGI